jgi:hypothetical protein
MQPLFARPLSRYVRELNAQEDHLSNLGSQIDALKTKRKRAAAQLGQTIEGIALDETF